MDIVKSLMGGVMAGVMVGIVSSVVILVLETLGFTVNTFGAMCGTACCCLGFGTFVVGLGLNAVVFVIAGLGALVAGIYAAKRISSFSAPSDMLVGGAVGGLGGGLMVALGASIVTIIYPIVSAVFVVIANLIGLAGAKKPDLVNFALNVAWNGIVTGVGWILVATAIFFVLGVVFGLLGGLIGSFIFKAASKELD